jgi:hypothetical protein
MYNWGSVEYLGAAHGVIGIMHQLLQCSNEAIEKHKEIIKETIQQIIHLQFEDGNFPAERTLFHILCLLYSFFFFFSDLHL